MLKSKHIAKYSTSDWKLELKEVKIGSFLLKQQINQAHRTTTNHIEPKAIAFQNKLKH